HTGLDAGRRFREGVQGVAVQIPRSRLAKEKRPPEIGPGGRSWCEFRCEFLATTQRFQLSRHDSDCPEHRVSTTFRRASIPLFAASGPGGRWFKSTRPDCQLRIVDCGLGALVTFNSQSEIRNPKSS